MPLMSRIAPMSVEPPLQRLYQLLGMAQGIKILKAQKFGPQEVKVGRRRQWSIKSIHDRRKLNHIESLEVVVVCPFHCRDLMTWNCTCLLNFLISVFGERLLSQNCARLAERRMHLPRVYNCGTKQEVIFILFCLLGHGVFENCGKEKNNIKTFENDVSCFPAASGGSLSLSLCLLLQEVLRSTAITCNQIAATGNRWPWGAIGFIEDGIVDVAASLPELPRAWWLPHFLECRNHDSCLGMIPKSIDHEFPWWIPLNLQAPANQTHLGG